MRRQARSGRAHNSLAGLDISACCPVSFRSARSCARLRRSRPCPAPARSEARWTSIHRRTRASSSTSSAARAMDQRAQPEVVDDQQVGGREAQ